MKKCHGREQRWLIYGILFGYWKRKKNGIWFNDFYSEATSKRHSWIKTWPWKKKIFKSTQIRHKVMYPGLRLSKTSITLIMKLNECFWTCSSIGIGCWHTCNCFHICFTHKTDGPWPLYGPRIFFLCSSSRYSPSNQERLWIPWYNRLYCNCIKGLSIFVVVVAFSKGDPSSLLRLQSTAGCWGRILITASHKGSNPAF